MNKYLIFLFGILMILPLASAIDVAYLVPHPSTPAGEYIPILNEYNYTYDIISEDEINTTDFSSYEAIIVGDGAFSSPEAIPINEHNTLVINVNHNEDLGLSTRHGQYSSPTQVRLNQNLDSVIKENVNENFNAYTISDANVKTHALTGGKPVGIQVVAYKTLIGNSIVAYFNPGTELKNDKITEERILYFGIIESDYWTADSRQLFINSLIWVVEGQDKDDDGYYDDDCDDSDPEINPGATEIPYDGIDQDCSGGDLNDLDEDGYIGGVAGGDDCNDFDSDVNPGSSDLTKNCVNDAPVLINNIPNLTWDEDESNFIDIGEYFEDPEGDDLEFAIFQTTNNDNVSLFFSGDIAFFSSSQNWYGEDWIIFSVSDGDNIVSSNNVSLIVNPVNDGPTINNIPDVSVLVGELVKIVPSASDPENDTIIFNFSAPLDDLGEWQTVSGDEGIYDIEVTAEDSNGETSNAAFIVQVVPELVINEFVSDSSNEWIEIYNPTNQEFDLQGFTIEDNTQNPFNISGNIAGKGFFVADNFPFNLNNPGDQIVLKFDVMEVDRVSYGDFDDGNTTDNAEAPNNDESSGRSPDGGDTNNDLADFEIFENPTQGLSNSADVVAPSIQLISPTDNIVLNTRESLFEFSVSDNSDEVECSLYTNVNGNFEIVDSVNVSIPDGNGDFTLENLADGNYIWNVECSDSRNSAFSDSNRSFEISAPDTPIFNIISNQVAHENELLVFSVSASDPDGDDLIYRAENLPDGALFSGQQFSWTPNFSQSGFYEVEFFANDSIYEVKQTVGISVLNARIPPAFSDAPVCDIKNDSIDIRIKDPDDNDKFEILELMEIEIEIEHDFDEDLDFDVEAHLYDIDEDESIEEADDELEIDEGDKEEVELEIEIPDDTEDNHDFALYVFVNDENDRCNSEFIDLRIEREDDFVIIEDFTVTPSIQDNGGEIELKVTVQNLGKDEQDVIVKVENEELGLFMESEEFELEEFDDDDSNTVSFFFEVDKDAEEKNYDIKATASYNGDRDTMTKTLGILSKPESNITIMKLNGDNGILDLKNGVQDLINDFTNYEKVENGKIEIEDERLKLKSSDAKSSGSQTNEENNYLVIVVVLLAVGIIILFIGVVVAATMRR